MSDLQDQVKQELKEVIGEIMDKYRLTVITSNTCAFCDSCGEDMYVDTGAMLNARAYSIDVIALFKELKPINYGKVKK